jgi:glycosyltransferase involved in cell wall biosynthesis
MNDTKIDNLAIVFMGYGELEEEVKNAANEQIFYHPAVPPIDLLNYTASADCGISLIADSCISYRYCTPNKLFEYSMAGLPVITSDLPEQARLVKKYKIGEVPESDRSSDLTAAILTIMKIKSYELKENLANFTNKYNWENQSLELTKIYEKN